MPYRTFDGQNCSIARALEVLGERWTLLILREVLLGRRRFEEIRRNTGVATNILTDRLATLVEHGVLERRGDEYVPTRKAIDANPVLVALLQWGDAHAAPDGPPRVLVHAPCGHDAEPALQCAHCEQEIRPGELRVRPGAGRERAPEGRADPAGAGLNRKPARNTPACGYCRGRAPDLSALGMLAAVLIAAPAADAQDRYALAGGCYGLKSIANGKFAAKTADGAYKAQADQAGAERFHLQATDLGRYLLFGKAGDFLANGHPAAGRQRRRPPDGRRDAGRADPGRGRAQRLRRLGGEAADGAYRLTLERRARAHRGRRRHAPARGPGDDGRSRAVRLRGARRLRGVAGGRDQRDRRADPRRHLLRRGERLRRRPHAHDGLRVPRRPRALRAPVAPLRRRRGAAGLPRPRPERDRRDRREHALLRQPGRHPRHARLAGAQGLAALRLAHARADLLQVARALVARAGSG